MSNLKSSKTFSQRLREGATKQELMQYFALTEEQYARVILCVQRIKKEEQR